MDSGKKKYVGFFGKTAYVAPNDIQNGYDLIGPMLYIFPTIAVHSPASRPIELSAQRSPATALLLEDYEHLLTRKDSKVGRPLLIATAFETFTDIEYRQSLHPDYQVRNDFDRLFVEESSPLHGRVQIVPDRRRRISQSVVDLVEHAPTMSRQVLSQLQMSGEFEKLELRLENYQRQESVPEPIRMLARLSQPKHIIAFSLYNYFNNIEASQAAGGSVDVISEEHRIATESMSGMKLAFPELHSSQPRIEEKVIHAILEVVCSARKHPATLEHVLWFREKYRDSFLRDVYDILDEVSKMKYDADKVLFARRLASETLTEYTLSSRLKQGLARILSCFSSGLAKDHEIVSIMEDIVGGRDWRYGMLKDPPISRMTRESRRENLDALSRMGSL